nr:hypothetical protein CFP56_45409 [Quercus suber]
MPHQVNFPYLFLAAPEASSPILLSLFLFLCSYLFLLPLFPRGSTLLLTNSPPSLTQTIYLSLRRNQTVTKVSASVVGTTNPQHSDAISLPSFILEQRKP